jgi:hypothetical protein
MESKKAQGAMNDALSNALTTAAPWLAISSAAVYAANSYWPAFRKSFGASGKTSLIIMPPIVAYNLAGEASVLRSLRADADGEAVATPSKRTGMTWHLKAANLFCEHTLLSFAVVITPMYGAILANELSKPRYEGWRLSHALIHTRVFGQAAAVGSLVLVFGFKDALRKMGAPFEI